MSISKLYIFTKDTSANASLRGYNYQTLKTLETWLSNLINSDEDVIYCDFEDDIFQLNYHTQSSTFRQIKLYSNNFSFNSKEIQKCIFNFFMLNVKTDYENSNKEFIFEANTNVAESYKNNDAKLLRDWVNNQNNISGNLLKSCSDKVRTIVSKFISNQSKSLEGKIDNILLSEAISIFDSLDENYWIDFTKKIKWKFTDRNPIDELDITISNIKSLISELPYNLDSDNIHSVFGQLFQEVSLRASNPDPEHRKLTNEELEIIILKSGDKDDKWYIEIFEKWKEVKEISFFNIGEFYEIIDSVNHCRRNNHLHNHVSQWLKLLEFYINRLQVRDEFRKKAIYEYLFLRIRLDEVTKLPLGDLLGNEDIVRDYFSDFKDFKNTVDLDNALNILHIIFSAIHSTKVELNFEEIVKWYRQFYKSLNYRLNLTININEKCHLLELLGLLFMFFKLARKKASKNHDFHKYFEELISLVDKAPHYNVSKFHNRINQFIDFLIKINDEENSNLICELQSFAKRLDPIVHKRESYFKNGKTLFERGNSYYSTKDPKQILYALNSFHKAKESLNKKESIEHFVVTLLNISKLYINIELNFAAKYFALASFWVCINDEDKSLLQRSIDSIAHVFFSDFKQGSWISAILSFEIYLIARFNFDSNQIDLEKEDNRDFVSISYYVNMLLIMDSLSTQFSVLVSSKLNFLNIFFDADSLNLINNYETSSIPDHEIRDYCEKTLNDFPLNDIGKSRNIHFKALGSFWKFSFNNDYITTSIAEEYIALIQIVLAEISLSKYDFHFVKGAISIEFEITENILEPVQLESNSEFKWKVFICYFENPDLKEIEEHSLNCLSSLIMILSQISLLKQEDFVSLVEGLYQEKDFAIKTFSVNKYQRMYRKIFSKDFYDQYQREHFQPISLNYNLPTENSILQWKSDLSLRYSKDNAIEFIKNRYKNSYSCIYLTLEKLQKNTEFHQFINDLRDRGYLDWQIVLAILNFILNYKTNLKIKYTNKKFSSDIEREEYRQMIFHKYLNLDEKECYIEFPLEAFKTQMFVLNLNNYMLSYLKILDLDYKAKFPNFEAIKEFLDIRFNMKNDNTDEGNPLKNI